MSDERQEALPTVTVINGRKTIIDADVLAPMYWDAIDLILAVQGQERDK